MKRAALKLLFPALFIALLGTACLKRTEYPPNPVIAYKDFIKYGNDSANFIFTFTDGDGDIGLNEADTFGNFAPGQVHYYNFVMTYYYKDANGNFVLFDADPDTPAKLDTLQFKYRIPDITPRGHNKVLEGEMRIKLHAPYYGPGHQVFKFEAYIYDRSLQKSNVIVSPELTP